MSLILEFVRVNGSAGLWRAFHGGRSAPSADWSFRAAELERQILAGSWDVPVQVRSNAELLGVFGAFSARGPGGSPVVLINREWTERLAGRGFVTRVLVEEFGHAMDVVLNGDQDTPGDEGEAFAAQVLGTRLNSEVLSRIATEDDRLRLRLDGTEVMVETVALLFSYQAFFAGTADLEANALTLGAAVSGVKFLLVSDPSSAFIYSGNNVRGTLYAVNSANEVVASYFGEACRLVKSGSSILGVQFYVYPNPASPTTGTPSQVIVLNVSGTAFSSKYTTGSAVKTSSDPIDSALNSLIPTNQPPTVVADTATAAMPDCAGSGTATNPTGNVITNDSDADTAYRIDFVPNPDLMVPDTAKSSLVVSAISSNATSASAPVVSGTTSANGAAVKGQYGSLTIGADGTYVYTVDTANTALIALRSGQNVTDVFTYSLSDGTATRTTTLTVTVNGGNNAPVAVNDFTAVNEVAINALQASGNVKTNDSDPDTGDTFTVTQASKGSSLSGTPTTVTSGGSSSFTGTANYVYSSVTFQNNPSSAVAGLEVFVGGTGTGVFVNSVSSKTVTFKTTSSGSTTAYLRISTSSVIGFGVSTDNVGTITSVQGTGTSSFSISSLGTNTISVGTVVTGEGIPNGTTVTAVNGAVITLSAAATLGSTSTTLGDGESLSFVGGSILGDYGYLSLKTDGTYQYYLTANVPTDTTVNEFFTYKLADASCSSTAVLQIQIRGDQVNAPVANADTRTVVENPGTGSGTGVFSGNVLTLDTFGSAADSTTGVNTGLNVTNAWLDTAAGSASSVSSTFASGGATLAGTYGSLKIGSDGAYAYTLNNPRMRSWRRA